MTVLEQVLSTALIITAAYVGINLYISSELTTDAKSTWAAMSESKFSCPKGTEPSLDGWSKTGYSRTCINLKHGKWEAWDQGYKHIEGFYEHGNKHGTWSFFKEDGSIYQTVEYKNGQEVKVVKVNEQ